MKTTRAPSLRNRRPARGPARALSGPTRTILTPRGAIVVGELCHELPREDIAAAYRGRILEDPIELGGPSTSEATPA